MINYLNLSSEMKNFIKNFDYINLTKDIVNDHNWKNIPLDVVLTSEGKQWFSDRKISLRDDVLLFKIPKNVEGPIHIDSNRPDCAFNFVLSGHGEMQWIENLEATEYIFKLNGTDYNRYRDIKKFDITDVWTGDIALVKINIPHRVVTTNLDRYCISIRLNKEILPNKFDEISKLFGV